MNNISIFFFKWENFPLSTLPNIGWQPFFRAIQGGGRQKSGEPAAFLPPPKLGPIPWEWQQLVPRDVASWLRNKRSQKFLGCMVQLLLNCENHFWKTQNRAFNKCELIRHKKIAGSINNFFMKNFWSSFVEKTRNELRSVSHDKWLIIISYNCYSFIHAFIYLLPMCNIILVLQVFVTIVGS